MVSMREPGGTWSWGSRRIRPHFLQHDASGVFVLLKGRGVGEELGVEGISGRGASFQEQLKSVQDQRWMDTRLPLPRAAAETDVVCTV